MEPRDKLKIKAIEVTLSAKDWGIEGFDGYAKGLNAKVEECIYYGFSAYEAYPYMRDYIDTCEFFGAKKTAMQSVANDLLVALYGDNAVYDAMTKYK